jgi:hypothetical protein
MKMNDKTFLVLFFLLCSHVFIFSKRVVVQRNTGMERFKDKQWLNQNSWFQILPLQEILKKNQQIDSCLKNPIVYRKIVDKVPFDYPEFSIALKFPHSGYFEELFILTIPQGRVQGECGYVFVDDKLSDEMARGDRFECLANIPKIPENNIQKISGRVAVIAQHGSNKNIANYYHWVCEVLGRLALLEIGGVEYDWLYVGMPKKFMKETLRLWGVNFEKIIEPTDEQFCIEADELILPSMVINTSVGHAHAGNFQHPVTLQYVKDKLLAGANKENIDCSKFSSKVFISRKDSYNARRILNEDAIFELFQKKDFERYELSKMSVPEQIILFAHAEIVVSEQGSGLTNVLFCRPNTIVVEIFQALIDNCFWWMSNALDLQYIPIKTLPIDVDYFAHFRDKNFSSIFKAVLNQTNVPLDNIKKFADANC